MTEQTVLFDLDGVLIDNLEFESAVTECLIGHLATSEGTTLPVARDAWSRELTQTKGDSRWYDYDFHCANLGLPKLAQEAHHICADKLRVRPGAGALLGDLRMREAGFAIATDALGWVADFKLRTADLPSPDFVMSSEQAQAPKADASYWRYLNSHYCDLGTAIYVDNRLGNLRQAMRAAPSVETIYFDALEHVLTLEDVITEVPLQKDTLDSTISVVHSMEELAKLLL